MVTEPAQKQGAVESSVPDLARRMKGGAGPLHELTTAVARAIHETRYRGHSWENDRQHDQWLAVGTWREAEAVVGVLPFAVVKR